MATVIKNSEKTPFATSKDANSSLVIKHLDKDMMEKAHDVNKQHVFEDKHHHGVSGKDHHVVKDGEHQVTLKEMFGDCLATKYILALVNAGGDKNILNSDEAHKDLAHAFDAKFAMAALEADAKTNVESNCQKSVSEVLEKANNMFDHCLKHIAEEKLHQSPEVIEKALKLIKIDEINTKLTDFLTNAFEVGKAVNLDSKTSETISEQVLGIHLNNETEVVQPQTMFYI